MSAPFSKIMCAFALGFSFLYAVSGCARAPEYAYEDGTYRGIFADGDSIQVNVEFRLEGGRMVSARFRHLRRDGDYFLGTDQEPYRSVVRQYEEALEYLVGKDLEKHLPDLYSPEAVVKTQVHGYTAATVRSSKIISAVRDALNRGVYSR